MKRKRYSAEFRAQAVELVQNGRPVKEVAQELEIEPSCLYSWLRKAAGQGGGVAPADGSGADAAELKRLRRENQKLQLENAILKKAAIILGTNPQPERER